MSTTNLSVIPVKAGDNIVIIGRRFFDKKGGNTYFSSVGLINGVKVIEIPYDYGYDEQYAYETYKKMKDVGFMPDAVTHGNGSLEAFDRYCIRKGITLYTHVSDVSTKKDL